LNRTPVTKGSLGHSFKARPVTEGQSQRSFSPYGPREISVLTELRIGHPCYSVMDVPPQPNSPSDNVEHLGHAGWRLMPETSVRTPSPCNAVSRAAIRVLVFQRRQSSQLRYTSNAAPHCQIRVKLNRVFFPRFPRQARSLGCWFAESRAETVGISLIHSYASLIRRRGIWLP